MKIKHFVAHPNVRVFVTQGGLQSIEEAIDRAVPMVGLSFVFDQTMNTQKMVEVGIGISLDPFTVTKEELKKSIVDVAENYRLGFKLRTFVAFDSWFLVTKNVFWRFETFCLISVYKVSKTFFGGLNML